MSALMLSPKVQRMQRSIRINEGQLLGLAEKARYDSRLAGFLHKRCSDSNKWLLRWFRLYQVNTICKLSKPFSWLHFILIFVYFAEFAVLLWQWTLLEAYRCDFPGRMLLRTGFESKYEWKIGSKINRENGNYTLMHNSNFHSKT